MLSEYLKHLLIRTPLERPLSALRELLGAPRQRLHPELHELYLEPGRIRELMRHTLRTDSNCLDVGCHLGSVLSEILRLAPKGRHIAFEPIPRKAAWLRAKFPEVEIKAMCLGDASGALAFHQNLARSGYSSLMDAGELGDPIKTIEVPCDRLDNVLPREYRVDFIKIDVEGAELRVFAGAVGTLRRWRPIVLFECGPAGLSNFGVDAAQVWRQVTDMETYCIFLIKDYLAGGQPLAVDAFESALRYPFQAFNFVAAPIADARSPCM